MKITNVTKNTILSSSSKKAISLWDRSFGLLDKRNPRSLIFYTHFGLHTFGLNKPIDIVVLDASNKVVKIAVSIKPNSLFFYNPKYGTVIELPERSIENSKTGINDKIELE